VPDLYTKEGDSYVPYNGPKLVVESDLVAAKASLQTQLDQAKAELTDAKTYADGNLQRAITAERDLTTVRAELDPLKNKAAQVDTLTSQVTALTTGKTELETKMLGIRRQEVATKFHIQGDKLKELESMDIAGLDNLETTLSKWGTTPNGSQDRIPRPNQFDTGGGGVGTGPDTTRGRDLIKQGLAQGQ
jgi:chromosome segregation ATPase